MLNIIKRKFNRKISKDIRHNFLVDLISYVFLGLANGLLVPFVFLVARKDLQCSPFCLGLMTSSLGIGMILAFFTTGLIKPNNEVKSYIYMNLIGRIANVILAFSINASVFSILYLWTTAMQAMPLPQYGIIIQNIYPSNKRATLISYTRIALTVTTLISTIIGGYLIDKLGWRPVFFISSIFIVLSSIVLFWFKVPKNEEERINISISQYLKYSIKLVKEDKLNRNIIIGAFIFVIGVQISTILFPITQSDILNVTKTQLGWLNGIYTIFWIIALWYFGPFIDKKGSVGGLNLSFILYIPICIIYIFVHNWTGLILAFIIQGIYMGCNSIAYFNMIIDLCPKGEEQIYQGVNSLWCGIRAFVDVIIGTIIINKILKFNFITTENKHVILYTFACIISFIGVIFIHITCKNNYSIKRNK